MRLTIISAICLVASLLSLLFGSGNLVSSSSFFLLIICPLASVALSLMAWRRGEYRTVSMGIFATSLILTVLIAAGTFASLETRSIIPESCYLANGWSCSNPELVANAQGTMFRVKITNELGAAALFDTPAGSAALPDFLIENGLCAASPVLVRAGEQTILSCDIGSFNSSSQEKVRVLVGATYLVEGNNATQVLPIEVVVPISTS